MYDEGLKDLPVTSLVHYTDTYESSGHLYLMRINGYSEQQRNAFIAKMAEANIAMSGLIPSYSYDYVDYTSLYMNDDNVFQSTIIVCLTWRLENPEESGDY